MAAFFGFLVLVGLIVMVAALIRPGVILFRSANPTRAKAFALALVAEVAVIVIGVAVVPPSAPVPAVQQPASVPVAQATPVSPKFKGIGIGRAQASAVFGRLGCPLAKSSDVNGVERWMGNKNLVMCETVGPADELHRLFLLRGVAGDTALALEAITALHDVVKLADPGWADGGKWLVAAVTAKGGSTVRGARRIEVSLLPQLGLGISVTPVE